MSSPDAMEQAFEETVRALVSPAVNAVALRVDQGNRELAFAVEGYHESCEKQGERLGEHLQALKSALDETRSDLAANDLSDVLEGFLLEVDRANRDLRFDVEKYQEACEKQGVRLGENVQALHTTLAEIREEIAALDQSDVLKTFLGQMRGLVLDAQRVISAAPEHFLTVQEGHLAERDEADREQAQVLMGALMAQVKALDDPTLRQTVIHLKKDGDEIIAHLIGVENTTRWRSNLLLALTTVGIVLALLLVWLVVKGTP